MTKRLQTGLLAAALSAGLVPGSPAEAAPADGMHAAEDGQRRKRRKQRRRNAVVDQRGTVRQISGDVYGLEPDSDPGTRYLPETLPAEFKQEGLRVIFSGTVGEIPPNVRMMGTPFTLTDIRRLE